MNSGRTPLSCAAWLFLLLCTGAAFAVPLTLDALLEVFADVAAAEAHFTEVQTLALLDSPLTTKGRLSYRRPDYLKKEVIEPTPSVFEISGERLVVEAGAERHSLSLDSQPLIRAFAEAYRATLAGDRETLERYYRHELSGSTERWTLRLLPLDERMEERIEAIVLHGAGPQISRIEVFETAGDYSLMTIAPDVD